MKPDEIFRYMIIEGLRLDKKKLQKLSNVESNDQLLSALSKTYYGKFVKFEGDIADVELQLKKHSLKSAYYGRQRNPMSISSILSYMIKKIIEIGNIRSLAKSKHLGIEADYIEKNILVI